MKFNTPHSQETSSPRSGGFSTTREKDNEPDGSSSGSAVGMKSRSGFTLIELLVVIAIIGLLSSAVLASLSGSRGSARDAVRFQDLNQLRTAAELYYAQKGKYPCGDAPAIETVDGKQYSMDTSLSDGFISGPGSGDTIDSGNTWRGDGNSWQDQCGSGDYGGIDDVGSFPQKTREDPVNEGDSYYYTYQTTLGRTLYLLYVPLENSERAKNDGGLCDNYYEVGNGLGEIKIIEEATFITAPLDCN